MRKRLLGIFATVPLALALLFAPSSTGEAEAGHYTHVRYTMYAHYGTCADMWFRSWGSWQKVHRCGTFSIDTYLPHGDAAWNKIYGGNWPTCAIYVWGRHHVGTHDQDQRHFSDCYISSASYN